jgi:hypothetical protein
MARLMKEKKSENVIRPEPLKTTERCGIHRGRVRIGSARPADSSDPGYHYPGIRTVEAPEAGAAGSASGQPWWVFFRSRAILAHPDLTLSLEQDAIREDL